MKILHLATSLYGGAGIAASRLHLATSQFGNSEILTRESLRRLGLSNHYLSSLRQISSRAVSAVQAPGITSRENLLTPISISFLTELKEFMYGRFWDAIHVHSTYNFLKLADIEYLKQYTGKIIITLHDERNFTGGCHYTSECKKYETKCLKCPQSRVWARPLISKTFSESVKKIDIISDEKVVFTAPSEWLLEKAKTSRILRSKEVKLIRNCVPEVYFDISGTDRYRVIDDKLSVGFISQDLHNPYKGLGTLLSAYRHLQQDGVDKLSLRLLGNDTLGDVPRDVDIYKSSSDAETKNFLEGLDVLVVPSLEDNLPSVILEALSVGKVVVGSAVGGIAEILHKFGMPLFRANDTDSLKEILGRIDPKDFNASEISRLAKCEFGIGAIAKKLEEIYSK